MANYAASVLATGQAQLAPKLNTPEQRRKNPTVFELAIKNQEFSIPHAQTLRTSPLRPVSIYYNKNIAAGSATTKAYNHTGSMGDSGAATVVYVQTVETFSLTEKIAANNFLTYQQMFNNQYMMAWKNLRTRQDTAALAYLTTYKNQLSNATMTTRLASANPGYWNDTAGYFALEISSANSTQFINKAKSAMAASYYTGEYDCITDLQLGANFAQYMNQGAGNQANLNWQFNNVRFAETQDVVNSNYTAGSSLWLPKGMFAGLYWNEQLNKTGLINPDKGGSIGTIGTIADPFGSGCEADISMYTQRADTSADTTGGSTEDFVDQWEVTVTVGYILPPLVLASDSVVMEIAQQAGVA